MSRIGFPWLALGLGLLVAIGLGLGGAFGPEGDQALPLLTLLIITEFGFFVTAIGAGLGLRTLLRQGMQPAMLLTTLGCALLAILFLVTGIRLWPGGSPF